jgi:hypothetical protein
MSNLQMFHATGIAILFFGSLLLLYIYARKEDL